MLDKQIIELARAQIRLQISEQSDRLQKEIGGLRAQASAHGMLRSSRMALTVAQACSNAVAERGQLAWQMLYRYVTTAGVRHDESLGADLKEVVSEFLPPELSDLKGHVKDALQGLSNGAASRELEKMVEDARVTTLAKVNNEIDLFTVSLKNQQSAGKEKAEGTVFNFYSPVGTIQTGPNAVAHVHQIIDAQTRELLNEVLASVEAKLGEIDALPTSPKQEVVEIVVEAKTEVAKAQPNATKLRALLSGIAAAVQTVGAMKPAYDSLRTALTYIGLP